MRRLGMAPPSGAPAPDARLPGSAVRVAFALAGLGLSVVDYRFTDWLVIAVVLTSVAAAAPRSLLAWGLILFLALGQLTRHDALSSRFLVLLAGLHLLHVLAMLSLEVPARSWMQPTVLVAPALRFVAIQVPSQILAIAAMLLVAPRPNGHRPLTIAAFALLGALALVGLVLVLLRPPSADE